MNKKALPPIPNLHGVDRLWVFLGVGLGSGLTPKAQGTSGSAAILLLVPLLVWLGFWPSLCLVLLVSVVGVPICGKTAALMGVHDDGRIVWDEFAGQLIALLPLIYVGALTGWNLPSLLWVLLAFGLFRLFDVWKPWPISWLDRQVHGGLGIMLDDLVAGVIAAAVLWLALWQWF
ncbi:MAG: phosphatidylglycerophosphatase A [Pseudomonadota bacterium]|nr:phosphatidylglycerophosphatase A [Pseudomonadota bacterium]